MTEVEMKNKNLKMSLILSLVSGLTFATTWDDMELSERYQLKNDLQLSSNLVLNKGESFDMLDQFGGDAPIIYMQFHRLNCVDVDQASEIEIYPIKDRDGREYQIGAAMEENCNLGLYVEPTNFYAESIFEFGPSSDVRVEMYHGF